jgi:hypothetical protein
MHKIVCGVTAPLSQNRPLAAVHFVDFVLFYNYLHSQQLKARYFN